MFGGIFQVYGALFGYILGRTSLKFPDISGGLCLTMFIPWIMFHAGVMIEMKNLVSNLKVIVFRGMIDNFVTLVSVSLGTYYLFPVIGIEPLDLADHLVIGAVFMPVTFLLQLPAFPFPLIEILDDHSIVFGEGALGTALCLILLKHVKTVDLLHLNINSSIAIRVCFYLAYMIVASSLLGLLIGLLLSFRGVLAKFIASKLYDSGYRLNMHRIASLLKLPQGATIILFIPAYLSYMLAEYLNLSGTMCAFFYGIATTYYILPEDPKYKTFWRDDIHRIFTILKWLLQWWIGVTTISTHQWKSLEDRLGMVFGLSVTLFGTLTFGRLVSVHPLSWCCSGQKKTQQFTSEFANPWKLNLDYRWSILKAKLAEYEPNPLIFRRWGLSNIESHVLKWIRVEYAISYLRTIVLASTVLPSMLSYVVAYDQLKNSENKQLSQVHMCIVIVYMCTSTVFGAWDNYTVDMFEMNAHREIRKIALEAAKKKP